MLWEWSSSAEMWLWIVGSALVGTAFGLWLAHARRRRHDRATLVRSSSEGSSMGKNGGDDDGTFWVVVVGLLVAIFAGTAGTILLADYYDKKKKLRLEAAKRKYTCPGCGGELVFEAEICPTCSEEIDWS